MCFGKWPVGGSPMHDGARYDRFVLRAIRFTVLLVSLVVVPITILAAFDLLLQLGWGYPWWTFPSLGFLLALLVCVDRMAKAVAERPRPPSVVGPSVVLRSRTIGQTQPDQ